MSARPRVTVAMVTYNSERFVREAIASVLAQDFLDFELLVCDDRSTDGTWEAICQFDDPRIRALRNPANLGEYPNRNQALQLARGALLIFIDGDDVIYPHGLGLMVKMMDAFPGCAFASAQPPSPKFVYPAELSPHQFYSCQFLGPNVTGANFTQLMFRTASLRRAGGFDERFRTGDTYIQYRLALVEPCVLITGGLAWWRQYPEQASHRVVRELWGLAELTRYGQEMLAHPDCPLNPEERQLAKANLLRLFLRNVQRYIRAGRVVHALRLLRRAGVSLPDWRHMFKQDRRPYLCEVDGANPVTGGSN